MTRLGYCIVLFLALSLAFDVGTASAQVTRGPFTFTPTTTSGVLLGQAQIEGMNAEAGDIIGVEDDAGNTAGAASVIVVEGLAYINLTIYGDDPTTAADEGMNEGELFNLKLYDASHDRTLSLINGLDGWANMNGAPIEAYSDPSTIYNFPLVSVLPDTPDLTVPQNGSTNVSVNPLLAWNVSNNAASYTVQLSLSPGFESTVADTTGYLDVTFEPEALEAFTTYFWRVRADNSLGSSDWSLTFGFTTGALPLPAAPILILPAAGASGQSQTVSFSWSPVPTAQSYAFELSTADDFGTLVSQKPSLTGSTTSVSSLLAATVYFWRVSATNSSGTGEWSEVRVFTTASEALSVPTLSSPSDTESGISLSPILVWQLSGVSTEFDVQVAPTASFVAPVVDLQAHSSLSLQVSGLDASTDYFWRVRAREGQDVGDWSEVFSFHTSDAVPETPVLVYPEDAQIDLPITNILLWSASERAESYELHVSTSNSFLDAIAAASDLPGTLFSLSGLDNGTQYFWRVRAKNGAGLSNWSVVRSFSTIQAIPGLPALVDPSNGAAGISTAPTLSWSGAVFAATYDVQVARDNSFLDLVYETFDISGTQVQVTGLTNETAYFWRVRGRNSRGSGSFTSAFQFVTQDGNLPAVITLSEPVDLETEVSLPVEFIWLEESTADQYQIQVALEDGFATPGIDIIEHSGTSYTSHDLASEATYFWRVRGTNTQGAGPWSTVRSFTTASLSVPGAVGLISPVDLSSGIEDSVTLTWATQPDADSYQVVVIENSATVLDLSGLEGTQVTLNTLETGRTYLWRVRGENAAGVGPWSLTFTFLTASGVATEDETLPTVLSIAGVYPNPASKSVTVEIELPSPEMVTLNVFDLQGRLKGRLWDAELPAGSHRRSFNLSSINLAAGMYLIDLSTRTERTIHQLVIH